uniref:Branched-chain amino acid aminotransferase n=1 Tax=Bionectria ochroleuca TaxID=29856 RepID=A0A0B7K5V3_BIOOC
MSAFPPPPVNTIDWSNVGFKVREVNGHIESTWSKSTGEWTPLRFVADPYMRIHGMAPALNYGQQAYEGLKAFRTPNDAAITIFRPDRNARRMQHSADVVSMPRVPEELFLKAVRAAVALNAEFVPPHETGAALYIRPQIYGSSAQLGLSPPDDARHEEIDEFSTSGFIGAVVNPNDDKDVTLVVPSSKCIIDSVTSDSILQIGRSFGWKVEQRAIKYGELPAFSEVMAAGTAAALVPIRSITRRNAPAGGLPADSPREQEDAGAICLKLITQLKAIQLGKVEDAFGWRVEVGTNDLELAGPERERNGKTPTVDQME